MRASIILTFLTALFSLNTFAQSTEHTDNHEHHNNEIGIANGPVYFRKRCFPMDCMFTMFGKYPTQNLE